MRGDLAPVRSELKPTPTSIAVVSNSATIFLARDGPLPAPAYLSTRLIPQMVRMESSDVETAPFGRHGPAAHSRRARGGGVHQLLSSTFPAAIPQRKATE